MRRQIAVKIDQQLQIVYGSQRSGRVWKLFDCEAVWTLEEVGCSAGPEQASQIRSKKVHRCYTGCSLACILAKCSEIHVLRYILMFSNSTHEKFSF